MLWHDPMATHLDTQNYEMPPGVRFVVSVQRACSSGSHTRAAIAAELITERARCMHAYEKMREACNAQARRQPSERQSNPMQPAR